jgi:hypothetical protein
LPKVSLYSICLHLVFAGRYNEPLASMDRSLSRQGLHAVSTPIQYIEAGQGMAEFQHSYLWVNSQYHWAQTGAQLSLHRRRLQE